MEIFHQIAVEILLPLACSISVNTNPCGYMLSNIPIEIQKVSKIMIDQEILRAAIIAELDAVNLYEQMAAMASEEAIKSILLEVAKEEKTHVGEFQSLLLRMDLQHQSELKNGADEVDEVLGSNWKPAV